MWPPSARPGHGEEGGGAAQALWLRNYIVVHQQGMRRAGRSLRCRQHAAGEAAGAAENARLDDLHPTADPRAFCERGSPVTISPNWERRRGERLPASGAVTYAPVRSRPRETKLDMRANRRPLIHRSVPARALATAAGSMIPQAR
jgi:hypothetical protein